MKRKVALLLSTLLFLGMLACCRKGGRSSSSSSAVESSSLEVSSSESVESSSSDSSAPPLEQYDYNNEGLVDSLVEIDHENEIKILVFSDIQIIDKDQARTETRKNQVKNYDISRINELAFSYMRKGVETVQPDLILTNGDNIYGEFDDDGSVLTAWIAEMESYKIPWAPVFGNHDNESAKGAIWQCEQLENAEHCLFKRGTTDGNGNYTVGLERRGRLERVIYCMDSNGCGGAFNPTQNGVLTSRQFTQNQLQWLDLTAEKIEEEYEETVNSSLLYHIPTTDFLTAEAAKYGSNNSIYHLNLSMEAEEGDFGSKGEFPQTFSASYNGDSFHNLLKEHGMDSVFVGHEHNMNTSIQHDGIRYTYCVKTTAYDYHTPQQLGCTVIGVSHGEEANVYPYYFDEKYAQEEGNRVFIPIDFTQDTLPVELTSRLGPTLPTQIVENGSYDISKATAEDSYYFGRYFFMGDDLANGGFKYLVFDMKITDITDFSLFLLIGNRHTYIEKEKTYIKSLASGWQTDHTRISGSYLRIYNEGGGLEQQYITTESYGTKTTAKRSNLRTGQWYTVKIELAGRASYSDQGEYAVCSGKVQMKNIRFTKG